MQVLRFSSINFDVVVQTSDISNSWSRFRSRIGNGAKTYANYTANTPCSFNIYNPQDGQLVEFENGTSWKELWPVVFETCKYQISIRIHNVDKGTTPRVKHARRDVEELFFPDDDVSDGYKITGTIDFLNEPGLFKLDFEYHLGGRRHSVSLSWDVVSPKLDTKNDYLSIIRAVDREYENIVFRYLSLTYQQLSEGRTNNDVIWLNTFEELVEHYLRHVESIVNQPHTNLNSRTAYAKADRIKRWTVQMEERYAEVKRENRLEQHYFAFREPISTVDSLENRFVKHSVEHIGKRLQTIIERIIRGDNGAKRGDQIAESRKQELRTYSERLHRLARHPFFRNVGRWQGMSGESLVLQSRQGYMQVYKDWLKLRRGIDLYNGAANIGTLQIWEIYELWCFIKMKHLVREVMYIPATYPIYEQLVIEPKNSILNPFTDTHLEHTITFHYPSLEQADLESLQGEDLELARQQLIAHKDDEVTIHYQHTFNRSKQDGFNIHTATTEQRPDIVLNIRKKGSQEILLTYLYDAKYRVWSDPKLDADFEDADIAEQIELAKGGIGADYPPSDAINQMHRYRDAIYYGTLDSSDGKKRLRHTSKEIIGGYILFPGRGDDESIDKRYFSESVRTVNIGAFPLTPCANEANEGMHLRRHLVEILMEKSVAYQHVKKSIPQRGLKYEDAAPQSPVLLIGYAAKENVEVIFTHHYYYIRASRGSKNFTLEPGMTTAKYILLHTDQRPDSPSRWLFEITGRPEFVSGLDLRNMGFVRSEKSADTDMYIGYKISNEPILLPDFDIKAVSIPNNKTHFIPHFRTIANPDV